MDLKTVIKRNWLAILLGIALVITLIQYFDIKKKYDLMTNKYEETTSEVKDLEGEKNDLEYKVRELEND